MNLAVLRHLPLLPILAFFVIVFQLLSSVQLFVTPWTAACQASPSFTILWSLLKLYLVSDAIQSSHPLFPPSPPALNLSQHQGLSQ